MSMDDNAGIAASRALGVTCARRLVLRIIAGLLLLSLSTVRLYAQPQSLAESLAKADVIVAVPDDQAATLYYNNRKIVDFRARILGRLPRDRAAAAVRFLDDLVARGVAGPVTTYATGDVNVVRVGVDDVFAVVPADVDVLSGTAVQQVAAEAGQHLTVALGEAAELRQPRRLLWGGVQSLLVTVLLVGLLWALRRGTTAAEHKLQRAADRQLERLPGGEVVRASRWPDVLHRLVTLSSGLVALFLAYAWLTFVLRRFPYTRPWGESLREFLLSRLSWLALGIIQSLPALVTVVLIFIVTRIAVRLANLFFDSVEKGRLSMPGVYAETVQPTRRILTVVLWLFGLAAAYPHLPGSQTDAFKGLSVVVGLMISLGSSGIVNQVMSGFTITYSRALRLGDFVRIGDVEGTVTHLGTLSTKIKTERREEVTIPNAVVISQVMTNYSRFAESEGVLLPTTVTIGYDAPWRQVHALLLLAAERTPGIRQQPPPVVRQSKLDDFYVAYTLLMVPEEPHLRLVVLDRLHANIQDAFNEHGVQIMSPHYEMDPQAAKLVPRDRWNLPPAPQASEDK
jgi:small-conductance mechanosensitive channel